MILRFVLFAIALALPVAAWAAPPLTIDQLQAQETQAETSLRNQIVATRDRQLVAQQERSAATAQWWAKVWRDLPPRQPPARPAMPPHPPAPPPPTAPARR